LNEEILVDVVEYLVAYGLQGEFGRFRPVRPMACRRGDRVVVRSQRGLEIGAVLREATQRHAHFLPNTTVGALLRQASPEDEDQSEIQRQRAGQLLDRSARLAQEQGLPLEVIDAEFLLDGEHAVLHHLRWQDCDVRPFVSTLSRAFAVQLTLADLTRSHQEEPHHEEAGCGACGSGGCGRCGSGGGCATCGSARPEEVQAYFAQLRQKMDRRYTLL
jgi:cell fate regulator YaaT (PSP1 superfamily)